MSGPYYGDFPTSGVVYMVFDTFSASTGAPTAVTNFAAADVLIYKNVGTTQRSSANGITVTTSFDSLTGLQTVAIDTSDNTDAGFYAAGNEYQVAITPFTADGQTMTFWLGTFSIQRAGGVLAVLLARTPNAAAGAAGGLFIAGTNAATTVTTSFTTTFTGNLTGSVGSVTGLTASNLDATISSRMATYAQPTGFLAATFPATVASPTNITAGTITTVTNLTNAPTAGDFTSTMKTSLNAATPASVVGAVGSVTGSVGSVVGLTASNLDATISSRMATYTQPTGFLAATFPATFNNLSQADVRTSVGLATANLDTQLGAINAKTTNLPSDPADESLIIAATDAIMTRIGVAGVGLTNLGDARLANLDATVSSRSIYAGGPVASVTAAVTLDGTQVLTEAYAAKGDPLTIANALYMPVQFMANMSISGTTMTVFERDGTTPAFTLTLDSATTPAAIEQAT